MQRAGQGDITEENLYKLPPSQNVSASCSPDVRSQDLEAGVKVLPSVPGQPVAENAIHPSGNKEGFLEETRRADPDDLDPTSSDEKGNFPEGGLKGWSVVVGSFCGALAVFGIINTQAVLLEYFSAHQLKEYTPSQIGWIFGFYLFLTFFCGAPIGPIFDSYGPRALIFAGSISIVASMFLLGLCTRRSSPQSFISRN